MTFVGLHILLCTHRNFSKHLQAQHHVSQKLAWYELPAQAQLQALTLVLSLPRMIKLVV